MDTHEPKIETGYGEMTKGTHYSRSWGLWMGATFGYAMLTLLLTFPQGLYIGSRVKAKWDGTIHTDALNYIWILGWQAHALRHCPGRFWDSNIYFPATNTLAYSSMSIGFIPLANPIIWITGNPVLAYNTCVLAAYVLCALSMFGLVLELTGDTLAAGVAGFAFAFTPLRFGYYGQLHVIQSQWMVAALWCFHRYLRTLHLRYAVGVFVLPLVQGLFCGYSFVYFCTLLPLLWLVYAYLDIRQRIRRNLIMALLFFPCLASVILPIYWPFIKNQRTRGFVRSLEENVRYSADVSSYLTVPRTHLLYGRWLDARADTEPQAFPGFALLTLAFGGALAGLRGSDPDRRRAVIAYLIWGGAAFLLSLGPVIQIYGHRLCVGPFRVLYDFAPGYSGLRAPARFAVLVMITLCVCAGYGIHAMLQWRTVKPQRAALVTALGLLAMESMHIPLPLVRLPLEADQPEVYRWLKKQPESTAVVEIPLDLDINDWNYVYASVYHWRKLVNGVSAYYPPENVAKLLIFFLGLGSPACTSLMADLGVDYAIIHSDRMPVPMHKLVLAPGFQFLRRFGDAYVFRVMRGRAKARCKAKHTWREVPRHRWRVIVNAPSNSPEYLLDGDSRTLWRTTEPPREGFGLIFDLGASWRLGRLRMEFGQAGNEFPRYFRVRVSTDRRAWREIVGKTDMPRCWADVYRSALAHPRNPSLDLTFPPVDCRYFAIELLPHKGYSGWRWSMAEIRAYTPIRTTTRR